MAWSARPTRSRRRFKPISASARPILCSGSWTHRKPMACASLPKPSHPLSNHEYISPFAFCFSPLSTQWRGAGGEVCSSSLPEVGEGLGVGSMPVKIAVIGTGWWATNAHIPGLIDYGADIVLVDPNPAALQAAASHYHLSAAYPNLKAALVDHPDLKGAIVAVPHRFHDEVGREVLES